MMQVENQVRGMWALSRHQWQVWAEAPFAFALICITLLCTATTPFAMWTHIEMRLVSGDVWHCCGRAAPSQRRDGGVVESSRNWPDRYCRPAKIITCWNGNPVCRAEMDQEIVAKDISRCISPKYYNIRLKFVLNENIFCWNVESALFCAIGSNFCFVLGFFLEMTLKRQEKAAQM